MSLNTRLPIELLIRRMETISLLDDHEKAALRALPVREAEYRADEDIICEGDRPLRTFFILEGMTCAHKMASETRRQIVSLHMPGDAPDLQSLHLGRLDMSISTLTASRIGFIQHATLRDLCRQFPRVGDALWRQTLADASIFREWITSIGQRPAASRIAHLFCELFVKAKAIGIVERSTIAMPLTQTELGEALGLSTVHVNRSLQDLRARGLLQLRDGALTVLDWHGLARTGQFTPDYLHLREPIGLLEDA